MNLLGDDMGEMDYSIPAILSGSLPLAVYVGNTMIDSLLKHKEKAKGSKILNKLGLVKESNTINPYAVLTLHRPSSVDDRETLQNILEGLSEVAGHIRIIFPCHPRTLKQIEKFELQKYFTFSKSKTVEGFNTSQAERPTDLQELNEIDYTYDSNDYFPDHLGKQISIVGSMGYLDFLCLTSHSELIITDSGGLQEESTVLGVPCVTLRENTERPITVKEGTNVIAGRDKQTIIAQSLQQLNHPKGLMKPAHSTDLANSMDDQGNLPRGWDGLAGERIVKILTAIVNPNDSNN